MENNTISIKQTFTIFILLIIAPITRILPMYLAEYSKQASLISVILSIIPILLLIYMLHYIFKKNSYTSLIDFFENVFGKVISKILLIIYGIWTFILASIHVRYFAESFVNTIFPYVYLELIIGTLLGLILLIARKKIEFFARSSEVFFVMFLIIMVLLFLIRLPQIKIENIYPITTNDTGAILKGVYPIISIMCYLVYMFFLGDKISNKEELLREGKKTTAIITILLIIVALSTIGVFGHNVTQKFSLAYFKALKSADIFPTFQGLESILVSSWLISDFVGITAFIYILSKISKNIFRLNSSKTLITPIMFSLFIFSIFFAKNKFELDEFIEIISFKVNLILCIGIPILAILIGKILKKV